MNENQIGPKNVLDVTDCLEAIGVFRGWKNFLFVIIILCLLLSQICFWLVSIPGTREYFVQSGAEAKAEKSNVVRRAVSSNSLWDVNEATEQTAVAKSEPLGPGPNGAQAGAKVSEPESAGKGVRVGSFSGVTFKDLALLIRFVNGVLILAAATYCLTMLFSLKVSLVGRFGGMNHICRAFFLSLLMLILLLPWQSVFGGVVAGAIFTPGELQEWFSSQTRSVFGSVVGYLRFSGYWLLVIGLLSLSQFRSSRWARAILLRLEIV